MFSFILHADIGFNLDKILGLAKDNPNVYTASYVGGAIIAVLYGWFVWHRMHQTKEDLTTYDA